MKMKIVLELHEAIIQKTRELIERFNEAFKEEDRHANRNKSKRTSRKNKA
jgi:hypothetical protein